MASNLRTQLEAFKVLKTKQIQRAAARALNRAIVSVRAEAATRVKDELNLKVSDIKNAIVLGKANVNEALFDMRATVVVSAKPVPLYLFGPTTRTVKTARGPRTAVYVKVKRQGQRKIVKGAFVATTPNGHTGIFIRKGDPRLPIKELFSTTIRDVFKHSSLTKDVLAVGRAQFKKNFQSELAFQLSKVSG